MGRFDQDVETQFLGHFAWCIARLVAPVQKLIQQIFFLQVDKLSGHSASSFVDMDIGLGQY